MRLQSRRWLLLMMSIVITQNVSAEEPNLSEVKVIVKKIQGYISSKEIDKHIPELLQLLRNHNDDAVQAYAADALRSVTTREIRDGLITIIKDEKVNSGARLAWAWNALIGQASLITKEQLKEFLGDPKKYNQVDTFKLAALASNDPETRDFILKNVNGTSQYAKTQMIAFIEVQLGLVDNLKPCVPVGEDARKEYVDALQKIVSADKKLAYLAGWILVQMKISNGWAPVLEKVKEEFDDAMEKHLPLAILSGNVRQLEKITGKKFCDKWPEKEEEQEKVIRAWLDWMKSQSSEK